MDWKMNRVWFSENNNIIIGIGYCRLVFIFTHCPLQKNPLSTTHEATKTFFNVRNCKDREAKISQRRHYSLRCLTSFHIYVNVKSFPLMPKRLKSCKNAVSRQTLTCGVFHWRTSLRDFLFWQRITKIKSMVLVSRRFTLKTLHAPLLNYTMLKLF